jgi:protein phosphatase
VPVAAALGALVVGLVGLRLYLDSQWYVGVADGHVAVYRGIPAEVAGFRLHRVVTETEIPADRARELALYRDLDEGITAADRDEAEAIVEQIRADLARIATPAPGAP